MFGVFACRTTAELLTAIIAQTSSSTCCALFVCYVCLMLWPYFRASRALGRERCITMGFSNVSLIKLHYLASHPLASSLGLCFLGARRRSRFLVTPEKHFWGPNVFWGGRKSYLTAEPHDEAAPEKNEKKNNELFPLGRRKIRL